ncbi:MAG: RagB/SusD family nutrient uptake outer membrane protein [Muribaculaceae bacterium]|nr:RagB/SusD family nutrient uptake outer membrane protein [Muribaculaceae bacterium]
MKTINKLFISLGVAASAFTFSACTGDLDLTPTSPNDITPGLFPSDPKGYMQKSIADVYMQFCTYGYGTDDNGSNILASMDGGMSTFQRAVFNLQEIPSDEANWLPSGDAIPSTFQYGLISADDQVVMGVYSRLMVLVSLANQFQQTEYGITTDEEQQLFEEFCRQANILKAGAYYYLIDAYGNVPWADGSVTIGSVPPQLSTDFAEGRRMVFNEVTAMLEEIVAWYKSNDPQNRPPYGYVGLDVAESLLVKYYLNAEVYTGTPRWKECFDHAQAVIDRLATNGFVASDGNATGLCKAYHQNFGYNNKEFTISRGGNANEIIWVIPQESLAITGEYGLKAYANGGFMCNAWIGNSTDNATFHCNQSEYNSGNGWKCMSARRQFVEVFDWNADYSESADLRTRYWKTAADGFNINNDVFDQAHWGDNGFLAVKFSNWNIGESGYPEGDQPQAVDPLGIDYGMIRLAEIYLSAAEAALHGAGDQATALKYVNYIRERAEMPAYSQINLVELQNERQRELYTECTRRTDLIRYGKWISGYTWNWKYNVKNGRDFPDRFVVYPLPNVVCERNGYVQNPNF